VVDPRVGPLRRKVDLEVVCDLADLFRAARKPDHARMKQSDMGLELCRRILFWVYRDEQRLHRLAGGAQPIHRTRDRLQVRRTDVGADSARHVRSVPSIPPRARVALGLAEMFTKAAEAAAPATYQ